MSAGLRGLLSRGPLACLRAWLAGWYLHARTLTVTRLNEIREANERSFKEEQALRQHTVASLTARSGTPSGSSGGGSSSNGPATPTPEEANQQQEMNRVDTTLADVFQLLSLFFLTIGKSRSAPATYCQLATMMKLLDHMKESGVYTSNDLQPFKARLAELKGIIVAEVDYFNPVDSDTDAPHPPQETPLDVTTMAEDPVSHKALIKLLLRKHDRCQQRLNELLKSLSVISVDLVALHQKLINLRRQLVAIGAKGLKVNKGELDHVAEELRKIEASRVDGKFVVDEEQPTQGQQILSGLLEETFEILQEIHSREEEVDPQLRPIFDRLTEMRGQLEKLTLTHRWTLRETDLYNFQVSLQEIDRMRVDGKFVDSEGNKPHGQRVGAIRFQ